jgi:hypothetical protein
LIPFNLPLLNLQYIHLYIKNVCARIDQKLLVLKRFSLRIWILRVVIMHPMQGCLIFVKIFFEAFEGWLGGWFIRAKPGYCTSCTYIRYTYMQRTYSMWYAHATYISARLYFNQQYFLRKQVECSNK